MSDIISRMSRQRVLERSALIKKVFPVMRGKPLDGPGIGGSLSLLHTLCSVDLAAALKIAFTNGAISS